MRIRPLHPTSAASAGKINVTPLIDVVMVLIVFYLIVGQLASDRSVQVRLPTSPVGAAQPDRGVQLVAGVDEAGALFVLLDGEAVDLAQLSARLRDRMPELASASPDGPSVQTTPLSLRADRRLTYGQLAPIIDACRAANVVSLQLIAGKEASR